MTPLWIGWLLLPCIGMVLMGEGVKGQYAGPVLRDGDPARAALDARGHVCPTMDAEGVRQASAWGTPS